jgi:hypothetical protein
VNRVYEAALVTWRALIALAAVAITAGPARAAPPAAAAPGPLPSSIVLFVDADDDDADGVPDRDQAAAARASAEVQWLEAGAGSKEGLRAISGKGVRVLSGGGAFSEGSPPSELDARFGLLGVAAGAARLEFTSGTLDASIYEMMALDGDGAPVDMVASHASLSRTLPKSLLPKEDREIGETDAL